MKPTRVILLFVLLINCAAVTMAQSAGTLRPGAGVEAVNTINSAFRTQLIEVKNRNPRDLVDVLRGLLSGERGCEVTANNDFKTITVRDFPENITVIERALARLDMPPPPPVSYDVQLDVIAASRGGSEKTRAPEGLEEVIAQLRGTLQYTNYRYITSIINRVNENGAIDASGFTDPFFNSTFNAKVPYHYRLQNIHMVAEQQGNGVIGIGKLNFSCELPVVFESKSASGAQPQVQYRSANIETSLNLKEQEKVIVGTANVGSSDEAIILVVSVKRAH